VVERVGLYRSSQRSGRCGLMGKVGGTSMLEARVGYGAVVKCVSVAVLLTAGRDEVGSLVGFPPDPAMRRQRHGTPRPSAPAAAAGVAAGSHPAAGRC